MACNEPVKADGEDAKVVVVSKKQNSLQGPNPLPSHH